MYLRPKTLDEALRHLGETGARVAAGCTDLFPAAPDRRTLEGPLLDVTAIDGMKGIAREGETWRIGGATTWREIIAAPLPPGFTMLKEAAREVGSTQIQAAGTIAGNLCNASPAADGVPCLMALDASVRLQSLRGERVLSLAEFLTGPRRTALQSGELLVSVDVPAKGIEGRSRFLKLGARRYLVISIAMVAARLVIEEGRIARAALAVGACSAVARRLPEVEAALAGHPVDRPPGIDAGAVARALAPIDDIRADAAYRNEAAAELLRRAVSDLLSGQGAVA
ncbi:xanthine dehydrogenase family protein subunit M [Roseovarius sp. SCSIO 43702]|uniref:FAD binding domain-containing protein n=1 Tax=Roseovarius sp. SCSIO 43702 TaxID=2823043 RepID=UPI002175AF64|nr:FAD binding domain-containing protein [Roseovarius sp. SCSIO 43702]